MNNIVDQESKEISIIDVINGYKNNIVRLLIYFFIPVLFGLGLFFFTKPFIAETRTLTLDILIQNESVVSKISKSYFFNANHLNEAIERSELSPKILVDKQLISSFDMISGHSELNRIVDDYIARDFLSVSKQLYFKPEVVEGLRKDLISKGTNFRTIIFRSGNQNITDTDIKILMHKLIEVINENIGIDFDLANIKLKRLNELEINSPISSMDVNKINDRLSIIREYIDILDTDYGSFAPEINLKVSLSNLESSEDLFNYLIQENELYKNIVESRLMLDLEAIEKRIISTNKQFERLNIDLTSLNSSSNTNQTSNLSLDSSFIDTILTLGNSASSMNERTKYLEEINRIDNSKISLEKRLADLNLRTNFSISVDEARIYLINSLNKATLEINSYIDEVRRIKSEIKPIATLSNSQNVSQSQFSYSLKPILLLILGSFFISLFFVTIRVLKSLS